MTWNWNCLQRVMVSGNSTACDVYASITHGGAGNALLLLEHVNRMMELGFRITLTWLSIHCWPSAPWRNSNKRWIQWHKSNQISVVSSSGILFNINHRKVPISQKIRYFLQNFAQGLSWVVSYGKCKSWQERREATKLVHHYESVVYLDDRFIIVN